MSQSFQWLLGWSRPKQCGVSELRSASRDGSGEGLCPSTPDEHGVEVKMVAMKIASGKAPTSLCQSDCCPGKGGSPKGYWGTSASPVVRKQSPGLWEPETDAWDSGT